MTGKLKDQMSHYRHRTDCLCSLAGKSENNKMASRGVEVWGILYFHMFSDFSLPMLDPGNVKMISFLIFEGLELKDRYTMPRMPCSS